MKEKKYWSPIIRIHHAVILVVFVFSLFVKPEVKKIFWLIIATGMLSLLIQFFLHNVKSSSYNDKVKKHRHEV